jgi:hypothetical protein
MNYLAVDLPVLLTNEIDEKVDLRRVKIALHRLDIVPKKGEINREQYIALTQYFNERKTVSHYDAASVISFLGIPNVEQVLDRSIQWVIAVKNGYMAMSIREYRQLEEFIQFHSLQRQ